MKNVMIIDDSDVNLYLMQAIFENNPDINFIKENDSRKAIDLIKDSLPDLIILDLMMPYIDGFELLDLIKSDTSLAGIPILVMSAFLDEQSIVYLKKYGIRDYLSKPINLSETESKIQSLIRN